MVIYVTRNSKYEEVIIGEIKLLRKINVYSKKNNKCDYLLLGSFNPNEHEIIICEGITRFDGYPYNIDYIAENIDKQVIIGNHIVARVLHDQHRVEITPTTIQSLMVTSPVKEIR